VRLADGIEEGDVLTREDSFLKLVTWFTFYELAIFTVSVGWAG
jgi:hypothetical protein